MSGLEEMDPLKIHHPKRRPVKRDGQLMLGFSDPHQQQRLPEPNRSQCMSLLGRMLLGAIQAKREPQEQDRP